MSARELRATEGIREARSQQRSTADLPPTSAQPTDCYVRTADPPCHASPDPPGAVSRVANTVQHAANTSLHPPGAVSRITAPSHVIPAPTARRFTLSAPSRECHVRCVPVPSTTPRSRDLLRATRDRPPPKSADFTELRTTDTERSKMGTHGLPCVLFPHLEDTLKWVQGK